MKTKTATEKRERPIMFSGEMVKKILSGEKTQTRRVIKDDFAQKSKIVFQHENGLEGRWWSFATLFDETKPVIKRNCRWETNLYCPYGKVGDLLYIKENFCCVPEIDGGILFDLVYFDGEKKKPDFNKAADWETKNSRRCFENGKVWSTMREHKALFMPRWASRITLEITNIRVERIQTISDADAINEGIEKHNGLPPPKECGYLKNSVEVDRFARLWDSINKKRGFGWETNPFVWVIEFKKI